MFTLQLVKLSHPLITATVWLTLTHIFRIMVDLLNKIFIFAHEPISWHSGQEFLQVLHWLAIVSQIIVSIRNKFNKPQKKVVSNSAYCCKKYTFVQSSYLLFIQSLQLTADYVNVRKHFISLTYCYYYYFYYCGPGSSVGIATDYGLDGPGSNPGGDEIFRSSRPVLRPTQPPVKWVPVLSRG